MTLDEAIEHTKEVARTCDDSQCAAEHIQLAEWLRTARGADKASRWCTSKIRELEEENAKLSTQLTDVTESMGRVEERCAKLRELVQDFDKCLDTALWLAHGAGYPVMPDQKLFDSLRPRMRELGSEVQQ